MAKFGPATVAGISGRVIGGITRERGLTARLSGNHCRLARCEARR